jgi:hypothetical protein
MSIGNKAGVRPLRNSYIKNTVPVQPGVQAAFLICPIRNARQFQKAIRHENNPEAATPRESEVRA